jgi:hypothetical protein
MNITVSLHSRGFTNTVIEAEEDGLKTAYYSGREDNKNDISCGTLIQVLLDIFAPYGRVPFYSLHLKGSERLALGKVLLDLYRVFIKVRCNLGEICI